MKHELLASATDLDLWAERLEARSLLPKLVRRLVLGTAGDLERLEFRADEGVQLSGWDGIVRTRTGTAFVPVGDSRWELGCDIDIKGKADGEYEKRTKDPLGAVPKETDFVFVSPRRWPGKAKWVQTKLAEGGWRNVRAYDADDLGTWLEEAPAVHIWFSVLLGKRPEGVLDLQSFWEAWAVLTNPDTSAQLVIGGRTNAADELHSRMAAQCSSSALRGETPEEAIAFAAAAMQQWGSADGSALLARSIVVLKPTAWTALAARDKSLVLIPMFGTEANVPPLTAPKHHVVIPLGPGDGQPGGTAIELPRIHAAHAEDALRAMGVATGKVRDYAGTAHMSLSALRRRLARSPAMARPRWAEPVAGRGLIPALLLGEWDNDNEADRTIVEMLAGRAYKQVADSFLALSRSEDPPIRRIGDRWTMVCREDAWALLAPFLTDDDLKPLEGLVQEVLGEVDPRYDLPPADRWAAQIHGKQRKYSDALRSGLSSTLVLMAARSETPPFLAGPTGQEWSSRFVRLLLRNASSWHHWASLFRQLPRLAEAAPGEFLDAVEDGLGGPTPVLKSLFSDGDDAIFVTSPHTGLLWALEVLAWSPQYLGHSASVLARLVQLDPGGKTENRPRNSLRSIFLCWHPCTTASLECRLQVLDSLRARFPEVAWSLMLDILPESMGMAMGTAKPQCRDWVPSDDVAVRTVELLEAWSEVTSRLIVDAGTDPARWCILVRSLNCLLKGKVKLAVERLAQLPAEAMDPNGRVALWDALRLVVAKHRRFPDAKWALQAEVVGSLEKAMTDLRPHDPVRTNIWLFGHSPELPLPPPSDWRQREDQIAGMRTTAAKEVFLQRGFPGVVELARSVDDPTELGVALGGIDEVDSHESAILAETLGSSDAAKRNFAGGFLRGRARRKGAGWLDGLREAQGWVGWSLQQKVDYYRCLAFDGRTWELVDGEEGDLQRLYWSQASIYSHGSMSAEDRKRAALRLAQEGRVVSALKLLTLYREGRNDWITPVFIADLLEMFADGKNKEEWARSGLDYDVSRLLQDVAASGALEEQRLGRLEWAFLPLLRHGDYSPTVLPKALQTDPTFFVHVLELVYKPRNGPDQHLDDGQLFRARVGHQLLEEWHQPPGLVGDGTMDAAALSKWVAEATALARASDRLEVCENRIGQVLSRSPNGSDGVWPHEAVRELLEQIGSRRVENGISIGIYNSRGVTTRSLGEGGTQERSIASHYRGQSRALVDHWPRTGRLLERIADSYDSEAREEDIEAEIEKATT